MYTHTLMCTLIHIYKHVLVFENKQDTPKFTTADRILHSNKSETEFEITPRNIHTLNVQVRIMIETVP